MWNQISAIGTFAEHAFTKRYSYFDLLSLDRFRNSKNLRTLYVTSEQRFGSIVFERVQLYCREHPIVDCFITRYRTRCENPLICISRLILTTVKRVHFTELRRPRLSVLLTSRFKCFRVTAVQRKSCTVGPQLFSSTINGRTCVFKEPKRTDSTCHQIGAFVCFVRGRGMDSGGSEEGGVLVK